MQRSVLSADFYILLLVFLSVYFRQISVPFYISIPEKEKLPRLDSPRPLPNI